MAKKQKDAKLAGSKTSSQKRQFISFFSGALGMDIGLATGGLECLAVNEFDPIACRTIQKNIDRLHEANPPRLYPCDIRSLTAENLCKDLQIKSGELFAIVGGPPCQAFSTAGRRLGLNDERGNVFLHFIKLILDLKPQYAIFENVRGLLSAPFNHRPHSERGHGFPALSADERPGGALLHILRMLEAGGYKTTFNLYNTANFGVPQIRERLIFFASRDGLSVPFMVPTHDALGAGSLPVWRTFRDATKGLKKQVPESAKFPEARLRFYRLLKAGQNWRHLPDDLKREAMGASYYAGGGKTGFYRRIAWDKPAPTLVTSPSMPATDLCHPEELRPLSVQEYAALQTFPDWYEFEGKLVDKYRQIGNAVPCRFAETIAHHIIDFSEGRLKKLAEKRQLSRYVGTDHHSWRSEVEDRQQELFG